MYIVALTQIRILFLAESTPATEAEVDGGIGRVVVAMLDRFIGIDLVLECYEAVIISA